VPAERKQKQRDTIKTATTRQGNNKTGGGYLKLKSAAFISLGKLLREFDPLKIQYVII